MKAFNIIFCVLFLFSAALQYNDEDPYIWIPLYLYGAWLCYLATQKRFPSIAYLLGFVVYSTYAAYLLFYREGVMDWFQHHPSKDLVQSMKADKPWIEETRELGGLLILIVTLGINWIFARRRKRIARR